MRSRLSSGTRRRNHSPRGPRRRSQAHRHAADHGSRIVVALHIPLAIRDHTVVHPEVKSRLRSAARRLAASTRSADGDARFALSGWQLRTSSPAATTPSCRVLRLGRGQHRDTGLFSSRPPVETSSQPSASRSVSRLINRAHPAVIAPLALAHRRLDHSLCARPRNRFRRVESARRRRDLRTGGRNHEANARRVALGYEDERGAHACDLIWHRTMRRKKPALRRVEARERDHPGARLACTRTAAPSQSSAVALFGCDGSTISRSEWRGSHRAQAAREQLRQSQTPRRSDASPAVLRTTSTTFERDGGTPPRAGMPRTARRSLGSDEIQGDRPGGAAHAPLIAFSASR